MILFYHENSMLSKEILLAEEEAKHCLKVLRMHIGDCLYLTDGKGNLAEVTIISDTIKKCVVQVKNCLYYPKKHTHRIHIAIAPTKNADRMEWFVEKCVEIGVDEISFLHTEHTERSFFNDDRMLKKAISAMKQSLNFHLPILNPIQNLSNFFDKTTKLSPSTTQLFMAYVDKDLSLIHI